MNIESKVDMKPKNRFKIMIWLCCMISFLLLSINYIMYRMTAIEVFQPLWITFLTIEDFSLEKHSWEEIVVTTCGSELVHEWIIVFSFVPLLFAIPFGEFMVFFLTSIGAAIVDVMFVIMQRYNRPRLMRMIK